MQDSIYWTVRGWFFDYFGEAIGPFKTAEAAVNTEQLWLCE